MSDLPSGTITSTLSPPICPRCCPHPLSMVPVKARSEPAASSAMTRLRRKDGCVTGARIDSKRSPIAELASALSGADRDGLPGRGPGGSGRDRDAPAAVPAQRSPPLLSVGDGGVHGHQRVCEVKKLAGSVDGGAAALAGCETPRRRGHAEHRPELAAGKLRGINIRAISIGGR